MNLTRQTFVSIVVCTAIIFSSNLAASETVSVYSARKEALIKPLLDRFSEATGIKVKLLTGKADGLLKRIQVEGRSTRADVFITVDAGRLQRAVSGNVLQTVSSEKLEAAVPSQLRDPDGYWYSLSQRARPIFYAKERVDATQIQRYEDLADAKWQGKLCLRSSDAVYNQSLVASKLAISNPEETETWIRGMVSNLARNPVGGDTEQLLALAAGACDITVVNTYYFGRLIASEKDDEREVASKIGVIWPNQEDRGTHVNVSGAGVTRHARNKENAIRLIEFLLEPESQAWYAEVNNEYPVREGTRIAQRLSDLGDFRADNVNLQVLGELNLEAVKVMDRAGWR